MNLSPILRSAGAENTPLVHETALRAGATAIVQSIRAVCWLSEIAQLMVDRRIR